eukprot:TRINITY_DN3385_c0_g1_i1.p1 TRINITY_DN3385_c0_g1~~TRINITY_DN3385_c0_g1_i1.p1  ORF type:complete len:489 (-),score=152.49 TRINITY_DN3385_c0_g1_i1:66-1532(-)
MRSSLLFLLLVIVISACAVPFFAEVDVEYSKTDTKTPISVFSATLASDEKRGRTALVGEQISLWSFLISSNTVEDAWTSTTTTSTTGGGQSTTTTTGGGITITTASSGGISTTTTGTGGSTSGSSSGRVNSKVEDWSTTTTTSTTGGGRSTTTTTGGGITITTASSSGISTTTTGSGDSTTGTSSGRPHVEGWTTTTTTSTTTGGATTSTSTGGPITITTGSTSGISTTTTGSGASTSGSSSGRANSEVEDWSTTTTTSTTGGGRTTTTTTGGPITITTGPFSGISTTTTGSAGSTSGSSSGGRAKAQVNALGGNGFKPTKSGHNITETGSHHSNHTTKTKHHSKTKSGPTKPHPSKPKPSHHGSPNFEESVSTSQQVGYFQRNGRNCQVSRTQVPLGLFDHSDYFWWKKDAKHSGSCGNSGYLLSKTTQINGKPANIRGCFSENSIPKWIEIVTEPMTCTISFKTFSLASFDSNSDTFKVPHTCTQN